MWHRWVYKTPDDRTCRVCARQEIWTTEVVNGSVPFERVYWEATVDGDWDQHRLGPLGWGLLALLAFAALCVGPPILTSLHGGCR